jgi:hypothetical protein
MFAGTFIGNVANMPPEAVASPPSIGKNADTWAAGIMATRLLTEYFPFDDVLSARHSPEALCCSQDILIATPVVAACIFRARTSDAAPACRCGGPLCPLCMRPCMLAIW